MEGRIIRYSGGQDGDTGRLYTPTPSNGILDNNIYTKSHTYTDTLNPFAPQTQFNYGFITREPGDYSLPFNYNNDNNVSK